MNYWLLKSEPNVWSIDQQIKAGSNGVDWEGVRNYQASNNLKKIKQISHLKLFKQSRLSVIPVDYKSWKIIVKMGKIQEK